MSIYFSSALSIYVFGAVVFLTFCREVVLGGWKQLIFTGACWPVVLILVFYKKYSQKDDL